MTRRMDYWEIYLQFLLVCRVNNVNYAKCGLYYSLPVNHIILEKRPNTAKVRHLEKAVKFDTMSAGAASL